MSPDLSQPLVAIPVLFAGGVLTSLNPCIYPMIPITAAIVGGSELGVGSSELGVGSSQLGVGSSELGVGSSQLGVGSSELGVGSSELGVRPKRRTVLLTLTYVVGLASVYSLLGLVAGLTGTMFGAISTNPWLYFLMANLLAFSALMLFDVIPVPVPRSLIAKAAGMGTAGRFGGALVMGAVSGLVAAPCGAPIMAAVLTWVTTTQSATLGFVYLLSFSLGMCTLLVIVGLSSGALARLPKSGMWMVWVKKGFGLVMLGVAEYYLIKMGQLLI